LVNLPLDLLLLVWGYGLQSMNLLGKWSTREDVDKWWVHG
jgi:hypothetical protein